VLDGSELIGGEAGVAVDELLESLIWSEIGLSVDATGRSKMKSGSRGGADDCGGYRGAEELPSAGIVTVFFNRHDVSSP
jgi:hypothetical protein